MATAQRRTQSNSPNLSADLTIGGSGVVMATGPDEKPTDEMDHLWFDVVEREAGHWQAEAIAQTLAALPQLLAGIKDVVVDDPSVTEGATPGSPFLRETFSIFT